MLIVLESLLYNSAIDCCVRHVEVLALFVCQVLCRYHVAVFVDR